ncbi:MAG: phosphopantothenoylcysteine decarboxylase [Planctomycetes bacterium]|nr:phosphopantothenoylcysteine decarboxylase [Planctomycetota bacterium]
MVSILITAGPTREHLDDVRFLSNGSSGRMGCALARAALAQGHAVTLVLGPVEIEPPAGVVLRRVVSALEMQAAAAAAFGAADVVVGAAAVADWRPAHRFDGKPARGAAAVTLELVPNPDILAGLAAGKGRRVVFGFGLESAAAGMSAAIARGRAKLERKQLDGIVVDLTTAIGRDAAEFVLCRPGVPDEPLPNDKAAAAARIVAAAVDVWRTRQAS